MCLSCICLLAMHTLICVFFSLPPGVGCGFCLWLFLDFSVYLFKYVLFYQFYSKIITFFDQDNSVRLLSYTLTAKRLTETDVKMTSRHQNDVKIVILTSCTRVVLHPSCKTTFPSPGRVHRNHSRGISGCRSQHVPVESSSLHHHSIYL